MPFYTSEQILNQGFDSEAGSLKTSAAQLGTPGTGEPAHAGGSTGVIGWLRDILAKIAAFGTSAAPSADVLSVQYPNSYVGKATLGALNAALAVDTLGAAQIAFLFPQGTGAGTAVQFEGTNSNATVPVWISVKGIYPTGPILVSGPFSCGSGLVLVDASGFTQVRCRAVSYTSGPTEVLVTRSYSPATAMAQIDPAVSTVCSLKTQPDTTSYVGKATLGALNATFTVDTLGAAQIAFTNQQQMPAGMSFAIEGTNSNSATPVWSTLRFFSEIGNSIYTASSGATMGPGEKYIVSCAGITQVRIRISDYISGNWEILASRVFLPSVTANISQPINTIASQLFTIDANATYYTDTTTPLAANATFTGSTRTMAAGNNAFNAYFCSNTSGATFQIKVSTDNTNWSVGLPPVSSTANSPSNQSIRRTTQFYRVVCAAGAAAQSVLNIHSSQTPN